MYFSIVMIQKNQFKTVIIFVKRIEIQVFFKLIQTKYHGISVNKEISQSEKVYLGENKDPVYLKAEVRERNVTFFVSQDGISYTQVGEVLDMRNLSDERVDGNGFAGAMVGVTCQDLHGDGIQADFEWLDYSVCRE